MENKGKLLANGFRVGDRVIYMQGTYTEDKGTVIDRDFSFDVYDPSENVWALWDSDKMEQHCPIRNVKLLKESALHGEISIIVSTSNALDAVVISRVQYERLLEIEKKYEQVKKLFN